MIRKTLLLVLVMAVPAWGRDHAPAWVEVQSPHFTVVTDAAAKQGQHILDQFERMRWVFATLFPKSNVDPVAPIVVVAVKDQRDLRTLEPQAYLAKGQLQLAGLFLRTPDKNYILLRLDAEGEHPFSAVYHEYTHLEIGDATEWMPLWLNEGLAEFFQNTEIRDKEVLLGEPSGEELLFLQQNRLIPLPVLFRVDANSPYYHEEQKGSVFYAESWALTHYLETTSAKDHVNRIGDYLNRVSEHEDPVTAAEQAFGNLQRLQATLEEYTRSGQYQYFKLSSAAARIDEASFSVKPLTEAQADAVRADFLVYAGRGDDARTLLNAVLEADPNNVQAHETMGVLEFRLGHAADAKKWFGEAVALDPENAFAQYSLARSAMAEGSTGDEVESSLRAAIRLNPRLAPAYDGLAVFYGKRQEKLDVAHMLTLQAIQLDPGNVNYRLDAARILMEQQQYTGAVEVLEAAARVARNPLEAAVVERMLERAKAGR